MIIEVPWLPNGRWGMAPLWPIVLMRKGYRTPQRVNHENIHLAQHVDCAIVGCILLSLATVINEYPLWVPLLSVFSFHVVYFTNVGLNKLKSKTWDLADHRTLFEREADANDANMAYLKNRLYWAWLEYL